MNIRGDCSAEIAGPLSVESRSVAQKARHAWFKVGQAGRKRSRSSWYVADGLMLSRATGFDKGAQPEDGVEPGADVQLKAKSDTRRASTTVTGGYRLAGGGAGKQRHHRAACSLPVAVGRAGVIGLRSIGGDS